ncbi:uncharacterized protein LOC120176745 [Hibiscus syriacus]|uniref:uncharacterized protein LOC120176745 n=1 Tax=Hibiscus syriacus TaxID=106335 RepID=UPI0019215770|nr:uncharacterized protein LOC120176745 [Hibiscus syriacus]
MIGGQEYVTSKSFRYGWFPGGKINCGRWEFANEGFQGGKKHLLKGIKRKSKYNSTYNIGLEAEIGVLKKNQSELQIEVMKLRKKNEESKDKLSDYEDRIRFTECRQQQIFIFLAKLVKFPSLFQQLIQNKQQQQKELDEGGFSSKKRKLLETQVTNSLPDPMETDQSVGNSAAKPMGTDRGVPKNVARPTGTDQSVAKNVAKPMGTDQSIAKNVTEPMGTDQSVAKNVAKPMETDQSVTKNLPEPKETDQKVTKRLSEPMEIDHSITKSLPESKETDQSVINCINQIYQEGLESMQSNNFTKFLHDRLEKELGTCMVDQKNITAAETSSVYHVMAENLLGGSSCVENATIEEGLSVNVSEIYLELEDLINWKPSSLIGFASDLPVEQTGSL